ncbi:MAG: type II toxin-antitoxin system VapC family toxin, partial [Meiothermus sp.]|uniref:type II toxin-antitoxin system VapC family toxin n=2 Tax=Meiothermus sp. TaxID=1955249 RepID=UPI00298EFF2B
WFSSPLTPKKDPPPHKSNSKVKKAPLSMSKSKENDLVIFDTSALIQIHTQETFSPLALSVYRTAKYIGICNLVIPEVAGATGAMVRNKSINKTERKAIQSFLLQNVENWLVLPVSKTVCQKAFDLCQTHLLKGADAIHLAAALAMNIFRPLRFFTLDKSLYTAAKKEKLAVVSILEFEHGR